MNNCPDCGKSISLKAKRCSCGWVKAEQQKSVTSDYRCRYAIANRRCPQQGTICPHPYSNGPWYCGEHWLTLNAPQLAEAALIRAEISYQKIKEITP